MKRRILSIDFDYFIDTDIITRENNFPDGVDVKPKEELDKEWDYFYDKYPHIKDIGVIDTFDYAIGSLKELRFGEVFIADSHKEIGKIFPKIDPNDKLEVVHIDFHHDNYISGGNTLDCANWVRFLMQRPNTTIQWLKREDSEVTSLMGDYPYGMTNDFYIDGEFDYIFICYSPEWTPPHLYEKFVELCKSVGHLVVE